MADEPAWIQYTDEESFHKAAASITKALLDVRPISRSQATDIYQNIGPQNISVTDSFDRRDYEYFRDGESLPRTWKQIIAACMQAYDRFGIVRNVIDTMADLAMKGIDINHPNEKIEKFHKEWFRRVGGIERSERFLNTLYRCGNVVLRRLTAKLTPRNEDEMRASAEAQVEVKPLPVLAKREIPWRYTIYNPVKLTLLGEETSVFLGGPDDFEYGIKLEDSVLRKLKNPKTQKDRELLARLPDGVRQLILEGERLIPLDPNNTIPFYYKRDDWQPWAKPIIYSVLPDLVTLEKLRLADMAALDGARSNIRVWKLGSLEHKILPSPTIVAKLAEMLANNVSGGFMDLIWGPAIDLLQTKTDVHHFLGETKYAPTMNAIYAGLGIPPTMTGAGQSGGYTNNFISLRTMVERLEYGRSILKAFWDQELRLVQKAMGFRFPATTVFDGLLADEAAEKQLMLHLWDRNLVSDESIQERFGCTPEIEAIRVRREQMRRERGKIPPKASPFHNPQHMDALEKIFAQSGAYAPSEFGLELEEVKPGEKLPLEVQKKNEAVKPSGEPGQGRPPLKKDSEKRKQKVVKPRSGNASEVFVDTLAWAEQTQTFLAKWATPLFLKTVNKNSLRELTEGESTSLERFKFGLLCQFSPEVEVNEAHLKEILSKPILVEGRISQLLRAAIGRYAERTGKEPTLEVIRRLQAGVVALDKGNFDEAGDSVDAA